MLPRIWVVVLTVLLLAAPAGAIGEVIDATAEHCDDVLVLGEPILVDTRPTRAICVACNAALPPAPAPARVFRPPRSTRT